MSSTLIDGGPIGLDESGEQYRNRILTDRAAWWVGLGARQGVHRGFDLSVVGGQMALLAAAGFAVVEERDAAGVANTGRGYTVWTDDAQTLTFDPASASSRNDAVVLAVVDTTVGASALGTETSAAGGQIVVVPGVSGIATPRTDSEISAAVGSGGWVRLADVLVAPGDTEVNPANVDASTSVSAAPDHLRVGLTADETFTGTMAIPFGAEGQRVGGQLSLEGSGAIKYNGATPVRAMVSGGASFATAGMTAGGSSINYRVRVNGVDQVRNELLASTGTTGGALSTSILLAPADEVDLYIGLSGTTGNSEVLAGPATFLTVSLLD